MQDYPTLTIDNPIVNTSPNKWIKEAIKYHALRGFTQKNIKLGFSFTPSKKDKEESNLYFNVYKIEIFFKLKQEGKIKIQ